MVWQSYRRVILPAIAMGLGYTVFREWLDIDIRQTWAYRDLMSSTPVIDAGLSPLIQWIIVSGLGFWWAKRLLQGDNL